MLNSSQFYWLLFCLKRIKQINKRGLAKKRNLLEPYELHFALCSLAVLQNYLFVTMLHNR